ncbi:MAG: hypothetical protein J6S67_22935 [Methanobrevibacter sp.]|nr:hypothetical protein [Methanobrevibacter sp.]
MTKEDKEIIKRATKEHWRIGDRSHLKRLLEKNLKLYRENVELEKRCEETQELLDKQIEATYKLDKENADLKRDKEDLIFVRNAKANHINELKDQLAKAKELLKMMYYLYFDPCVTEQDLKNRYKFFEVVKQFLKEIEK